MTLFAKGVQSINVGERLKAFREERRISICEMSRKSGISASAQSIVHSGHKFVLCLQGSLFNQVKDREFLLEASDSLLSTSNCAKDTRFPSPIFRLNFKICSRERFLRTSCREQRVNCS